MISLENNKTGGTAATGSGPCWNSASQYSEKYSKDDSTGRYECVQCSGKIAVKKLGDASSIQVDCSGNALNINRCDAACGADAVCDGKTPNTCSSEKGYRCDSGCNKVIDASCEGCTKDADCADTTKPYYDPNKPKCNIAKGECVECVCWKHRAFC